MNEKPPEDPNIVRGKALVEEAQRNARAMWEEVIRSRKLLKETRRLLDVTKPR